jgi:hypothetical protein
MTAPAPESFPDFCARVADEFRCDAPGPGRLRLLANVLVAKADQLDAEAAGGRPVPLSGPLADVMELAAAWEPRS